MALFHPDGRILSNEEAQGRIRETIRRCGRFLLASHIEPRIGEVQEFAGLPLRVVRYATREEYEASNALVEDLWGPISFCSEDVVFEVEVAD